MSEYGTDFGRILNGLLSGEISPEQAVEEAVKDVSVDPTKDRTLELLVESQRNEIMRLERGIDFLISKCISLSTKPHEQNADYWLEMVGNRR